MAPDTVRVREMTRWCDVTRLTDGPPSDLLYVTEFVTK